MINPYFIENTRSASSAGQQTNWLNQQQYNNSMYQNNPYFPSWGSNNVSGYSANYDNSNYQFPSWGSDNVKGYGSSDPWGDTNDTSTQQNNQQALSDVGGGALAGLGAGLSTNPYGEEKYVPGTWDGVKAAGQGAAKGGAMGGPVGALAGGIVGALTSSVMQPININKTIKSRNTSFNNTSYDAYGRPVYQGGDQINQGIEDIANLNKTMKWDSDNILGLNRKARKKRNAIMRNMEQSQQSYNNADISYRNQMNAQEDYNQRLNNNNRLYNLYRARY